MANEFIMPGKIVCGEGALDQAGTLFRTMGERALIVTDAAMVKLGNLDALTRVLDRVGVAYAVYSDITGEPTDKMVEAGAEVFRREGCDLLIALGGGSPIDTMKAIGVMARSGDHLRTYMGHEIEAEMPPMVAIPTTAGTGSEATRFTIITDTEKDVKMLLKGDVLMPDLAVIDPRSTLTSPPSLTAATGLDALCHAVEAYTSRKAQPLTDVFALSAVKRIFRYLPIAFREGDNVKAREEMSLAALEAGVAFNNSSVTIIHGMSRPVGALFHVPHGISNAMLLPACLAFALPGAPDRFAALGDAVGVTDGVTGDGEKASAFLRAVEALCRELKIPTLAGYGIDKEAFFDKMDKMADDALISGSPANTRRAPDKEDILAIYRELWR